LPFFIIFLIEKSIFNLLLHNKLSEYETERRSVGAMRHIQIYGQRNSVPFHFFTFSKRSKTHQKRRIEDLKCPLRKNKCLQKDVSDKKT
jgi:hypothetical protein